MEICVILPCNIYNAPFYKRYEKMIMERYEEFDFICWNRACIDEETKGVPILFNVRDSVNSGSPKKIINYIKFGNFVKRKLTTKKYDKIIILGSYAGIMVQLARFLKKNYDQKYWLDIRDFTFENIGFYYRGMKMAIENSYNTAISSKGYQEFLPAYNYVIAHNIDSENILKSKDIRSDYMRQKQIRISFIGLIRYYDENKKLLNRLGNDNRFILQYYGMNSEELKLYCSEKNITNVDFHGRFLPEETALFYKKTDIINNVYGNNSVAFTTALSNKLYFSAGLRIPILVCPNTYMEEVTVGRGFGFAIDYNDAQIGDKLYKWYMELMKNNNDAKYNEFYDAVIEEDCKFENELCKFLVI